ncbi:MAG: response regulator [Chitinophagaceae bacterium]|nr:response regulator [Chitinophagaceae bacterium]
MKKILIIDDDQDILDAMGAVLELSGYNVVVLQDATKIAQQVRTERPDVILLDIMLNDLDGRSLCYILKANEQYRFIPIIMFSGSQLEPEEVLRCGADDFITKPFELDVLMQKIEAFQPVFRPSSL